MAFCVLYLSMIKTNIKTYNVEFTTAFAGSPFINIVLEARTKTKLNGLLATFAVSVISVTQPSLMRLLLSPKKLTLLLMMKIMRFIHR